LNESNDRKPREDKEVSSTHFALEKNLVRSKAFQFLSGSSIKVYLLFCLKRQMQNLQTKKGKRDNWVIKNNGEIEFSYSEAETKGFIRSTFMRALTELIEKGFIDLIHSGSGGKKGDKSKYAISQRWRKYGTPEFESKTRLRDTRQGRGFARIWNDPLKREKLLSKRGQNSNIGIINDNPTVIKNDNPKKVVPILEYQKR